MKTTAELKIEISGVRISYANAVIMADGSCKLKLEVEKQDNEDYILVEASSLSLEEDFMRHEPQTFAEKRFKEVLTEVIQNGIDDFYRPVMDPSFADEEETKIHYKAGEKPAIGKSYNWWKETIKDSKWCFGTKSQYVAFLAILIRKLVHEKGWGIADAWHAVCNNSRELGHYADSMYDAVQLENTGSRKVMGFFDLANTYKILAEDEEENFFWAAGGSYSSENCFPLAAVEPSIEYNRKLIEGVAWLVLKSSNN